MGVWNSSVAELATPTLFHRRVVLLSEDISAGLSAVTSALSVWIGQGEL